MEQKIRIMQIYRDLIDSIEITKSELVCIMRLQPSTQSDVYTVKISYKLSHFSPQVWLLSPEIQKCDGKYPHHVYEKDKYGHYRLCVFDPKRKEWNQQLFIAEAFIPWICTWLNTYEYWLVTGKWHYDEAFSRGNQRNKHGLTVK